MSLIWYVLKVKKLYFGSSLQPRGSQGLLTIPGGQPKSKWNQKTLLRGYSFTNYIQRHGDGGSCNGKVTRSIFQILLSKLNPNKNLGE